MWRVRRGSGARWSFCGNWLRRQEGWVGAERRGWGCQKSISRCPHRVGQVDLEIENSSSTSSSSGAGATGTIQHSHPRATYRLLDRQHHPPPRRGRRHRGQSRWRSAGTCNATVGWMDPNSYPQARDGADGKLTGCANLGAAMGGRDSGSRRSRVRSCISGAGRGPITGGLRCG